MKYSPGIRLRWYQALIRTLYGGIQPPGRGVATRHGGGIEITPDITLHSFANVISRGINISIPQLCLFVDTALHMARNNDRLCTANSVTGQAILLTCVS